MDYNTYNHNYHISNEQFLCQKYLKLTMWMPYEQNEMMK
jgi:hypothetical protein